MTHVDAALCEKDGAAIDTFEVGPIKSTNVLVSTVVEAITAPELEILTVTLLTVRFVAFVSVTSLKVVAAEAAIGSSSATTETEAETKNFFVMRVR